MALTPSKFVENWIAPKTASGLGVTGPVNKASMALGKNGVVVGEGVSVTEGVLVNVGVSVIVEVSVIVGVNVMVGVSDGVGEGG